MTVIGSLRSAMNRELPRPLALMVVGAMLFCFYTSVATQFGRDMWPRGSCGAIFNAQAVAILAGEMHLDPAVLGDEAFVHDGRHYTYFGIWPALLRLPLLPFLDRDWTALSCALAASIATVFLLLTLRKAAESPRSSWPLRIMLLAMATTFVASGPQLELTAKPTVYVEAILWAYAFACAFIWNAFPLALGKTVTPARIAGLGALAALALQAKVTTGISLYAACGLMELCALWRARGVGTTSVIRLLAACALPLALGVLVAGSVNYARWGNPFEFADLSRNVFYSNDEARSSRLRTYGTFEIERIPHALKYYFTPDSFYAARRAEHGRGDITRLFDKAEGPPSSQFENKLAWWALGLVTLHGQWRMFRSGTGLRLFAIATLLSFALAPAIILSYGYLAFRFGAEFAPIAVLVALFSIRVMGRTNTSKPLSRFTMLFALMILTVSIAQIISAWTSAAEYVASDYTDSACD